MKFSGLDSVLCISTAREDDDDKTSSLLSLTDVELFQTVVC